MAFVGGCAPYVHDFSYKPDPSDYFPTDGERRAEYVSHDPAITWRLIVEKTAVELVDDTELVTFTWTRGDTLEPLGSVTWSSEQEEGVFVHAWTDAEGTEEVFDPPVTFGRRETMVRFEVVETRTGGRTFTSTLLGMEDCPVAWGLAWEDCLRVSLDDGDGDHASGPIFAGEYWQVRRYGTAWMLPTGYAEKWDLVDYEWTVDE